MKTEYIELRRDTVEQLIDLLKSDAIRGSNPPMRRDRRLAVSDRLRDQIARPDLIGLSGLPGAGKSFVAERLGEIYDAPVVTMGDAIREQYESEHGDGYTSDDLGKFAAQWRDDDPEAIPEKVVEIADRYHRGVGKYAEKQSDLIIIDGVRSVDDYEVLSEAADRFYHIEVEAPFYSRLERLQDRGREGEDGFTAVDLAERDEREKYELGYAELQEETAADIHVSNPRGERQLNQRLSSVVHNNLPFDIEDEEPLLPAIRGLPDHDSKL